jgi:hypothetical protein
MDVVLSWIMLDLHRRSIKFHPMVSVSRYGRGRACVGGKFEHLLQSILKLCLLVFVLRSIHDQTTFKYRCSIKTIDLMLPTYMACLRPT